MKSSLQLLAAAFLAPVIVVSASMRNDPGFDGGVIDRLLTQQLRTHKAADVFVKVWGEADLSTTNTLNAESRAAVTYKLLTDFAAQRQKSLTTFLDSRNARYQTLWIVNAVFVWGASESLVQELAQREDVEVIRANRETSIDALVQEQNSTQPAAVDPYLELIGATKVWARGFTGQNVVVASIDTGVYGNHQTLLENFRADDYSWFDPKGSSMGPSDGAGYGTHAMGTIAGSAASGFGVAHGAKWIAAKGCTTLTSCTTFDLSTSAQWVACPDAPFCAKRPHVVHNSWKMGQGDTWFLSFINAWRAANIFPVFAAGNTGPECSTSTSPADNTGAFAVAATDIDDRVASFSARGPGVLVSQKPDLSAPGVSVNSAWNVGPTILARVSGTSMAAAHVAGAAALLISSRPGIAVADIERIFYATAFQRLAQPTSGPTSCGGVSYDFYPNYIYGHGRIQIDAAVSLALATAE